jgi:hypothetical protein
MKNAIGHELCPELMERLGMYRISLCGGRKNRSSDEERLELTYEILV